MIVKNELFWEGESNLDVVTTASNYSDGNSINDNLAVIIDKLDTLCAQDKRSRSSHYQFLLCNSKDIRRIDPSITPCTYTFIPSDKVPEGKILMLTDEGIRAALTVLIKNHTYGIVTGTLSEDIVWKE